MSDSSGRQFETDLLESLRRCQLALTGRNRFLNFTHARAGNIRVTDELPDEPHHLLFSETELRFSAVRAPRDNAGAVREYEDLVQTLPENVLVLNNLAFLCQIGVTRVCWMMQSAPCRCWRSCAGRSRPKLICATIALARRPRQGAALGRCRNSRSF
jgi:hypothetical protein